MVVLFAIGYAVWGVWVAVTTFVVGRVAGAW